MRVGNRERRGNGRGVNGDLVDGGGGARHGLRGGGFGFGASVGVACGRVVLSRLGTVSNENIG